MLQNIRAFFEARDVLEIETPVLSSTTVTDPHLDSIAIGHPSTQYFLSTSPEYCMKRFIARHRKSVFQVAKCFREGEAGSRHNPEFSMLEWYRIGFNMEQLMQEVEALLMQLIAMRSTHGVSEQPTVVQTSYRRLFQGVTGFDPHVSTVEQCVQFARRQQIDMPVGMAIVQAQGLRGEAERDAWLDWIMSCLVTTALPENQLTFIYDYPQSQAALARCELHSAGYKVAKRFECYLGTLEIANGYNELLDATEQAERFERDNAVRAELGKNAMPRDEFFIQSLQAGLPECSGVAIGLDRILMALSAQQSIAETLNFPWDRI